MVASHTRTSQRRYSSSAISCRLAGARSVTISCRTAICSGFSAGGLPPGWTDGPEPSSERFVAMACFLPYSNSMPHLRHSFCLHPVSRCVESRRCPIDCRWRRQASAPLHSQQPLVGCTAIPFSTLAICVILAAQLTWERFRRHDDGPRKTLPSRTRLPATQTARIA